MAKNKKKYSKDEVKEATEEVQENNVQDIDLNNIIVNGTNDLICAKCFLNGVEKGAVGICKDCKFYMCGHCTLEHHRDPDFKKHKYAFFYCDKQLRANQLERANSFCLDCGHYLCTKCALDHGGFREYRHHTLIGGRKLDIPEGLQQIDTGLRRSQTFTFGMPRQDVNIRRKPHVQRTLPNSREAPALREKSNLSSNDTHRPSLFEKRQLQSRESRSSSRDKTQPQTQRPTRQSQVAVDRRNKQSVNINESAAVKPRILIHSTTGRRPLTDTPISKAKNEKANKESKRPKTVRYEDQHLAKPAALLGEFDLKGPEDKNSCNIVTSLTLDNDKLVVADIANTTLKLFDNQYKFASSYPIEKFPVALCKSTVNKSEFYASSGNEIYLIDATNTLKLVQTLTTDVIRIEGLATWSGGIAIIFTGKDSKADKKRHWEIHLLDPSGYVKYEVAVRPPFPVKLVTPIWYITVCKGDEQMIISDTYNNRIVCIDISKWHVVYVIKGRDSGGSPTSLMTDKHGYIHVTWYGEIHKFSEAGVDLGVSVSGIGKNAVISYSDSKECIAVCPDKDVKRDKLCVYKCT